jgi:hypothetical protein
MVFVNVYIHFRILTRIRNPRVTDPDPAKVPDPCGSGSTTLVQCMSVYTQYAVKVCIVEADMAVIV